MQSTVPFGRAVLRSCRNRFHDLHAAHSTLGASPAALGLQPLGLVLGLLGIVQVISRFLVDRDTEKFSTEGKLLSAKAIG